MERMDEVLFDTFPGPAAYVAKNGQILRVNDRVCNIWGLGRKDITGHYLQEFLGLDAHLGAFQSDKPRFGRHMYQYGAKNYEFLYLIIPDSENMDNVGLFCLQIAGFRGSELMEHLEITKNLVDMLLHAEIGILVVDELGHCVLLNSLVADILGVPVEEAIGRATFERGYRPLVLDALEQQRILKEVCPRKKGGEVHYFDVTAVPLMDGSKVVGGLSFVTDVTEKVSLEKKLIDADRMGLVGEMAARIMHDIRNPLQVVKSSVQILQLWNTKGTMDSLKVQGILENVDSAVNSMIEMMNDMLQFSKPSSDEQELLDLRDLLLKMALMLDSTFTKSHIDFALLAGQQCLIIGNQKLLHQAFLNILQNAIEVLEDFAGERRLMINCQKFDEYVRLEFFNTGPLIEEGIIDRIFDTFFSTKGKRGTGLGLSIAKEVVESGHGGRITCISNEKNQGTSFVLEFPLRSSV